MRGDKLAHDCPYIYARSNRALNQPIFGATSSISGGIDLRVGVRQTPCKVSATSVMSVRTYSTFAYFRGPDEQRGFLTILELSRSSRSVVFMTAYDSGSANAGQAMGWLAAECYRVIPAPGRARLGELSPT